MQGRTHRKSGRSRLRAIGTADGIPDGAGHKAGSARTGVLPPSEPLGGLRRNDPHDQGLALAGPKLSATAPGKLVEPAHRAAVKSVLDALTRNDLTAYAGLAVELRQQLGSKARWGLAWAALMACDDEEARTVIEAVFIANESMGGG